MGTFRTALCISTALILASPAVAQYLDNPCGPYTGQWMYQGLLEQRAAACQQQSDAAMRQQLQREAGEARARATEKARQRAAVAAQDAAEMSPGNVCRKPRTAAMIIDEFNTMPWPPYVSRHVVDIEHLVTISNDEDARVLSCHGIWLQSNGTRIEGTLTMRPNVADQMISNWVAEEWHPPILTNYAVTPPVSQGASAYQQGRSDRESWETWYSSLVGDYKEGAFYWSGQRSQPRPRSCSSPNRDFMAGFRASQAWLSPTDARRKAEPEYRAGWNSL